MHTAEHDAGPGIKLPSASSMDGAAALLSTTLVQASSRRALAQGMVLLLWRLWPVGLTKQEVALAITKLKPQQQQVDKADPRDE